MKFYFKVLYDLWQIQLLSCNDNKQTHIILFKKCMGNWFMDEWLELVLFFRYSNDLHKYSHLFAILHYISFWRYIYIYLKFSLFLENNISYCLNFSHNSLFNMRLISLLFKSIYNILLIRRAHIPNIIIKLLITHINVKIFVCYQVIFWLVIRISIFGNFIFD